MSNKDIIRSFYKEFFNDHNIKAAEKYIREDYIQHNPGVDQGRAGLMQGFSKKFETDPTFHLEIQMIICEDDMAAVYIKNIDARGNTKARVVDIYRIEGGMLAEHWDVLHPC